MADDQNLCPHCGQPMPETAEENLGNPNATLGTSTNKEENQRIEASTLVSTEDISEDQQSSLSWEGETIDDTLPEEVKEESLPEQVEKLNQQIKEYEEENEDPDVENPQNEH